MSVNKIFLLGRLGSAPSVRQAGERKVCSFRVATEEKWATGTPSTPGLVDLLLRRVATEEKWATGTQTEWHTVEAWGALGERCAQYLVQGQRVHVEGKLSSDEWERDSMMLDPMFFGRL